MGQQKKPVLCLTFDNMGEAHNVFLQKSAVPDPKSPAITEGFPNVLRLLAKYDLRATFFVEGWSILHYGDVIDSILQGDHEIGLHGWVHEVFADVPARAALQIINDGLQVAKLRGVQLNGFRAPGGRVGPFGRDILVKEGFLFDSSVDTAMPKEIPLDIDSYAGDGLTRLSNGLIGIPWQWFMIDAVHYMLAENGLRDPEDLAGYWGKIIRNVARKNGFVTIISHAHVTGVDAGRLATMEKILNLAMELGVDILPCHQAMTRTEHLVLEPVR